MKFKTLLLLPMVCWCAISFAQQKQHVYYYDQHLKPCGEQDAVFTGYGTSDNNLYRLLVVAANTKQPVIMQHYTDSSMTTMQGLYEVYYGDGSKNETGWYKKNVHDGIVTRWDSTGHKRDSINYDQGTVLDSTSFYRNLSGGIAGQRFTDVKNNSMHETDYNDSGKMTREIIFTGDKGVEKTYTASGVKVENLSTREEEDAQFPGGARAWTKYITHALQDNIEELQKHRNSSGTCIIKFIVDKEGNISDVEATTMKNTRLAKVCTEAIKNGPKWIPAKQFGRYVNAYRLQPVTFTFQN